MERGTRVIGMAAALVVAAFVLVFVALLAPSTRSWSVVIGIAYVVAAAVVLLAPRCRQATRRPRLPSSQAYLPS
jgi:fucose permease